MALLGRKIFVPRNTVPICPECGESLVQTKQLGRIFAVVGGLAVFIICGLVFAGLFQFQRYDRNPRLVSTPSPPATTPKLVDTAPTPNPAPIVPVPVTPVPTPPIPVALRFQGSNTIGDKLIGKWVEGFLANQGWRDVKPILGDVPGEYSYQGIAPRTSGVQSIQIAAHNSDTAFEGLARDECDIGMASRQITPTEKENLARLGDMSSPLCERVIGLDGIAIIVPRSNRLDALTRRQIKDIFTGKIREWSDVYGRPGRIHVYARPEKSGTLKSFKNLALDGAELGPMTARPDDNETLSDAVAADPMGIGFVGLPFIRNAKALKIPTASGLFYFPTAITVGQEVYPFTRRLYLYVPASPRNPLTVAFINYIHQDPEAQKMVNLCGFVGYDPSDPDPFVAITPPDGAPRSYVDLTAGAKEARFTCHFQFNSSELDGKASDDLENILGVLTPAKLRGRLVMLLGFADNKGGEAGSKNVSAKRAEVVAEKLRSSGVPVAITRAFGSLLPLADNSTEEGRNTNRRVEVWVK